MIGALTKAAPGDALDAAVQGGTYSVLRVKFIGRSKKSWCVYGIDMFDDGTNLHIEAQRGLTSACCVVVCCVSISAVS